MPDKLKVLSLFAGIGGFDLGLERTGGFETVAFCEIDEFCQKVLKKHWPEVDVYDDVRKLPRIGGIDVVCGGYPCQPFSTAGKRRGDEDDRHLWPAMFSVIKVERPSWVVGENVAGHVSMGLDEVLSDLESEGYTARPYIIPACATDAPHRRDRIWIIASRNDTNGDSQRSHRTELDEQRGGQPIDGQIGQSGQVCEVLARSRDAGERSSSDVANASSEGLQRRAITICDEKNRQATRGSLQSFLAYPQCRGQSRQRESVEPINSTKDRKGQANKSFDVREPRIWPTEPRVGRVANGISQRMDRLKTLGNSVVPDIPERIGYAILQAEANA